MGSYGAFYQRVASETGLEVVIVRHLQAAIQKAMEDAAYKLDFKYYQHIEHCF